MKVFYSPDYIAAAESFDTTRKSGWVAESLLSRPIVSVEMVVPPSLGFEEIAAVHESGYVTAVQTGEPRSLAESQGFTWDPGMWRAVVASTGGVAAAAIAAMSDGVAGSLSGGLHHARYNRGSGFCTFNGLAIVAKVVLAEGAASVLILDLDAHCGGGTHSLIEDDARIRQIDVSVNSFDHYKASGLNSLDMVRSADNYLSTIEGRLAEIDREEWKPALCLYNSGMDPDERCAIGGLSGIDSAILFERETLVFSWFRRSGIPAAFVMAGGYVGGALESEALVDLHRMTIAAASAEHT